MKTIYLDSDFKCHLVNDGTMAAFETEYFDDKCDIYAEGFRIVPKGESWTREDGEVFEGEMIAPWKDFAGLDAAQVQYDREMLDDLRANSIPVAELEAAYREGVNGAYD